MCVYVCVCGCLDLRRKQSNKAFRSHSFENYQQIIRLSARLQDSSAVWLRPSIFWGVTQLYW